MNGHTAGRCLILLALLLAALSIAGCGAVMSGGDQQAVSPPSNRTLAAQAVAAAFDRMTVPAEQGTTVGLFIESSGDTTAIVREALQAVLHRHGVTAADDAGHIPRITVRVDSLAVRITDTASGLFGRTIDRRATARILATWSEQAGDSIVYTGAGAAQDRIPAGSDDITGDSSPYVNYTRTDHPVRVFLKPAGLLAIMTVFVWSLYSYRG